MVLTIPSPGSIRPFAALLGKPVIAGSYWRVQIAILRWDEKVDPRSRIALSYR